MVEDKSIDSNVKEIFDLVENSLTTIKKELKKLGSTDEIINKFLSGEGIISCPYCKTFNMYELSYNKEQDFSMYKCGNPKCKKTYMKNYKNLVEELENKE